MSGHRWLIRGLLLIVAAIAASVAVTALREQGGTSPAAWAAVAAALAVFATLVTAWTSQRLVELQEDALEPNPQPVIDVRHRYQLAQFRLVNRGQSPAYNVSIRWEEPPLGDVGGSVVDLGPGGVLPVLGPGEAFSISLGSAHEFFTRYRDTTHTCMISFTNASGKVYSKRITISAEHERKAMLHNTEEPKTQFELQKLPERLETIAKEIAELRKTIDRRNRDESS